MKATNHAATAVLVWDWPLRVFHWALAVSVACSFATHYAGIEWFAWHRWSGYTVLVLALFRIAWGIVGPPPARFAAFVRGPAVVLAYLRSGTAKAQAQASHNPLGALSVLAMLALLLFQAGTGLFANDEIANAGPFFGWITQETSNRVTGWHELNSNALLGLLALHVAAVAWYDFRLGARLTRAMFTGRKYLPSGSVSIASSQPLRALVIIAVLAAILALAIRAAPEATFSFF